MRTTRLKVTLRDVHPRVLRVIDVPSTCTLAELHDLLQVALGWTDSHLHQFLADDVRYGVPDLEWDDLDHPVRDQNAATLRDLPITFEYQYDFGDNWEHDVEILGRGGPEPGCVFGEGACPPEDCGGTSGYEDFLEALANPTHPDHDTMVTWGGHWSPDFDRSATDQLLRDTVGQVPAGVRLVLDLLADGVKLTPGGRLPRTLVRQVQAQHPAWNHLDRPAQLEEDLPPLATLHDLLRDCGLARLRNGVLTATKAAGDDGQVVRRLRRLFAEGTFSNLLIGVATAELVAGGPRGLADLAAAVHPYFDGSWTTNGHPLTVEDLADSISRLGRTMRALDLIAPNWPEWHAGPSATTLLPRATALAHLWRHRDDQPDHEPA